MKMLMVLFLFGSVYLPALYAKQARDAVRIAAFNIQTFGQSKASKSEVMELLAQTISLYDLVLIQEIRDSRDGLVVHQLLDLTHRRSGRKFETTISPKLGRSSYTEQYAYVYNPQKLQLIKSWVFNDRLDHFAREPFIAHFRSQDIDFVTVGIHTQPDQATEEINALKLVELDLSNRLRLSNILIMGDLNADCDYFDTTQAGLRSFSTVSEVWIQDWEDTTVSSTHCAYDRIVSLGAISDRIQEPEITRFETLFGISNDAARDISDHYPVSINMLVLDSQEESQSTPVPDDYCGVNLYRTPKNYCYASKDGRKKRVASACCDLQGL